MRTMLPQDVRDKIADADVRGNEWLRKARQGKQRHGAIKRVLMNATARVITGWIAATSCAASADKGNQ